MNAKRGKKQKDTTPLGRAKNKNQNIKIKMVKYHI